MSGGNKLKNLSGRLQLHRRYISYDFNILYARNRKTNLIKLLGLQSFKHNLRKIRRKRTWTPLEYVYTSFDEASQKGESKHTVGFKFTLK